MMSVHSSVPGPSACSSKRGCGVESSKRWQKRSREEFWPFASFGKQPDYVGDMEPDKALMLNIGLERPSLTLHLLSQSIKCWS